MSTKMLRPSLMVTAHAMASSFNSDPVDISWSDNIAVQVAWTGSPTGTIGIQLCLDPDYGWESVTFTSPTQPTGSAGHYMYTLNQTPAAYLRLTYTASSGTGTLNAKIAAKAI